MEGGRIAMVAIVGLEPAAVMGSASTYARAGIGGVDGRALGAGTRLALSADADPGTATACSPSRPRPTPVRSAWCPVRRPTTSAPPRSTPWWAAVSRHHRGRPHGHPPRGRAQLEHAGAAEIVSDATVPGSIQVPGAGQPIVLLADAQTAGGYPKIATVIGADLGRLAALRPARACASPP